MGCVCGHWQALKERKQMELKQGENILHTALETALDYKVRTVEALDLEHALLPSHRTRSVGLVL